VFKRPLVFLWKFYPTLAPRKDALYPFVQKNEEKSHSEAKQRGKQRGQNRRRNRMRAFASVNLNRCQRGRNPDSPLSKESLHPTQSRPGGVGKRGGGTRPRARDLPQRLQLLRGGGVDLPRGRLQLVRLSLFCFWRDRCGGWWNLFQVELLWPSPAEQATCGNFESERASRKSHQRVPRDV
jgi:hypothetical protein